MAAATATQQRMAFGGVVVSFAGPLVGMAESEYAELVVRQGGRVTQTVERGQTTHLVSSADAEALTTNDYKMQWFPHLRDQLAAARALSLPIVSEDWLVRSADRGRREREGPYLLFVPRSDVSAPGAGAGKPSSLDPRVQELVGLLFDENELERSLVSLGLDGKKLLAGSDSAAGAVSEAYRVLAELDGLVRATPVAHDRVRQLAARLFALVPRLDASAKPQIATAADVQRELKVLEAIRDVDVAAEMLRRGRQSDVDARYALLHTRMEPVERHTAEFALIQQYVTNTHAHVHAGFSLEVAQLFKIARDGEAERFAPFERLPNHRLLWHGSRFSNFVGILTQGLRVAPPEAPVTGYFLGKGIYFADMCSKSAEYTHATPENNTGLLLLCEVALGRWFQIAHGKYITSEDLETAGFHSTKGCGEQAPDPAFDFTTSEGYTIPLGHEADTGVLCSELPHNEFIVYNPAQVIMRYLVKLTFTFTEQRPQLS